MIVGVSLLMAGIIISRILNEKAMKVLSQEDKARLIDGFSGARAYGFIPLVILIGAFIGLNKYSNLDKQMIFYVYIILLLAFVVGMQIFVSRKLTKLEFPKSYIKKFSFSRAVYFLGFGAFICLLLTK